MGHPAFRALFSSSPCDASSNCSVAPSSRLSSVEGHLWGFGSEDGLVGNEVNLDGSNNPRRRVLESGRRTLVFLVLFGLAAHAWPQQQGSQKSASSTGTSPPLVAGAALPEAPEWAPPAQSAPEQSSLGSIHGVVANSDGVVYEGVHVELAQTASDERTVRVAKSDNEGSFNFVGVPPGAFSLTISAKGFATQVISGVLHPGESYDTQQILLHVSATSEVRVTATQEEIATEQFRQEEKQRVLGVIPNFYVTYVPNAPPLSTKRKFSLALRTSIDPATFLLTGIWAGAQQGNDTFSGYGQGAQGYAKRFAANYADGFISTMIGGAILPSLLKQDPRYFYKGTGTIRARTLYALEMSVMCKGDNGHDQVNYSAILGSLAAGGISNLYYPSTDRNGVSLTFENALLGIAGNAAQNLLQEFLIRKLTPRVPNYAPVKGD